MFGAVTGAEQIVLRTDIPDKVVPNSLGISFGSGVVRKSSVGIHQLEGQMDPNLFHLDWERTVEALVLIIILAFVVERALAVVFENRIWLSRFDKPGVKELIAVGVSIGVCVTWKF